MRTAKCLSLRGSVVDRLFRNKLHTAIAIRLVGILGSRAICAVAYLADERRDLVDSICHATGKARRDTTIVVEQTVTSTVKRYRLQATLQKLKRVDVATAATTAP